MKFHCNTYVLNRLQTSNCFSPSHHIREIIYWTDANLKDWGNAWIFSRCSVHFTDDGLTMSPWGNFVFKHNIFSFNQLYNSFCWSNSRGCSGIYRSNSGFWLNHSHHSKKKMKRIPWFLVWSVAFCRWRDVKLRAFENAKHRTYVDLKVGSFPFIFLCRIIW